MPHWLNTVDTILTTGGSIVGGAVGNGMEAVGDGGGLPVHAHDVKKVEEVATGMKSCCSIL